MSDWVEIKLEHQVGGWVWFAVSTADGSAPMVVAHSQEAFATEDGARDDARKSLNDYAVFAARLAKTNTA